MKTKRLLCALMFAALVFTFLPATVWAVSSPDTIDLTDTATTNGNCWTYDSGTKIFTINDGADVTISGSVNDGTSLEVNGTATIILDGVSISTGADQSPLLLNAGASLTLILADGSTNTLSVTENVYVMGKAGVQVPDGTTLTIQGGATGDGSLYATGGYGSAGIGGNRNINAGTISIYGGNVTAQGGGLGAGIGGGYFSSGGTTTISGGIVIAQGGSDGAGIGGGGGSADTIGSSGTIIINGGDVTANGGDWSAGVGSGSTGMTNGSVDNILIYGENTTLFAQNGGHGAQDIGRGGTYGTYPAGAEGNVFVALTPATLTMSTPSPTPNPVMFSAMPASSDTITVTLPAPFSTTIDILSCPEETAENLSVITTLTTESISFALADYLNSPVSITGSELMQSGATVAFSSPSTDATLSSLVLSQGTLSPTFSSSANSYTVSVANNVSSVTVTPTANYSNATITVNGTTVTSGVASDPINLSTGDNTVTVTVTAQDGTTTQTYTVTVTRSASTGGGGSSSTTYYTITASAGEGGSISPSGSSSVAHGNDKTYTITPDEGYEIEDVLVDGVSVDTVSTYTFENVKKMHTIAASFKKAEIVNPFTDVTENDWFYNNVMYVYDNDLMTGTALDTFSPNGTMTRAMAVTVLYRIPGNSGATSNIFSDVASGVWYEQAAGWAAANNIANGIGDGLFAPDKRITREQLAMMLYNYAKFKGYDVSVNKDILSYNDILDISDYAYTALQWACSEGIIGGDSIGNLNPQSSATRAEVAAILERFMKISALL